MKVKGFTLVELMVVMAIIAFLSVGAYAGLTFALRQGRDTQRRNIVNQIQTALTAYYADFQTYPGCIYNSGKFGAGDPVGDGVDSTKTTVDLANVKACNTAFTSDTSSLINVRGKGGLAEYFEGEFSWGPFSKENNYNEIRYYYIRRTTDGAALRATVCAVTENPRGGNVERNDASKNKDCYCVGSDQSAIACAGMQKAQ